MSIYQEYAAFYDGSGQIRFAVLMGQYLGELLARHRVAGRRVLDMACGTGTLAIILADAGWNVVGVDGSAAMLARARERVASADAPANLRFVQADMRALPLDGQVPVLEATSFDLVTCTYDSLNYLLTPEDLAACVAGVARALKPGGLFVADMNTRHFLEHDWGTCEVIERSGFVQVLQSRFSPATDCSTMILTGFAGDDAQGYRRFDEIHIERAYDQEWVADCLTQAGFLIEAAYDCFTFQPADERSQRIAWVARRRTLER